MSKIVDTVEDRIQNAISTSIDSIEAPKYELAIRSINASSGQDPTSVISNLDCGELVGNNVSFENASGDNNVLHVSIITDESRNIIPDDVSELSVPDTCYDRQTHTHHMVTGQITQTNQISEFLAGRIITPQKPPSP